MWGRICSKPASILFALGPKDPYDFVLCKRCEQFLRLSPTSKKDMSHLQLISAELKWRCTTTTHVLGASLKNCCSGTPSLELNVYKLKVGRIFLRCGSKSQKLLTLLGKNKAVQVLQPQREQNACGLGTNPPP